MTRTPAFVSSRHLCAGASVVAGVTGLWIALNHPLSPVIALTVYVAWSFALTIWPRAWLFLLPALLPVLGLAPWSGWIGVDEFDLAVLATATGAYAAHGRRKESAGAWSGGARANFPIAASLGLAGMLWLALALAHAQSLTSAWFDGYDSPLNALRIAKGLFWPLLLLPLLNQRPDPASIDAPVGMLLARGIAAGTAVVALAAVWERLAFTGLWNTDIYYRTTALFWEMHVGGAAIEVFLVLALPFVVAQAIHARTNAWRVIAILLLLLAVYACVSTLSRSLYIALGVAAIPAVWVVAARRTQVVAGARGARLPKGLAAVALVATGAWVAQLLVPSIGYGGSLLVAGAMWTLLLVAELLRRPAGAVRWRDHAALAVALVLVVELGAVREGTAFLTSRLDRVSEDFVKRSAHWSGALSILESPADWLVGRGFGRFPVDYPERVKDIEYPGAFRVVAETGGRFARVVGPPTKRGIAGVFGVSQRVGPLAGGSFTATFEARAARGQPLLLSLCEKHLIYEAECEYEVVGIFPGEWQRYAVAIDAGHLQGGPWYAPRPVLFSVASASVGGQVDIDNVRLIDSDGRDRVANGDFSAAAAQWFFTGRYYFLPWHTDSVIVELLVERGVLGLVLFTWLLVGAIAAWAGPVGRQDPLSPYVVAALAGCAVLGLFSSVLDVPRNACLLTLLCLLRPVPDPMLTQQARQTV